MFNSLQKKDDEFLPPKMQQPMMQQMQQPMMQQMQQPMMMQQQIGGPSMSQGRTVGSSWLNEIKFPGIDEKLDVVSVIVTTHHGSSYDNLFRQVAQKPPEGRVSIYSLRTTGTKPLLEIMSGKEKAPEKDEIVQRFMKEISELEPDCVLFNWECCQGCSDQGFQAPETIAFVEFLVSKGHVLMFSDFAVKALIGAWDEKLLGPRVFTKIGECQNSLELHFEKKILEECGIPQLEAVAKISEKGECQLHCLGGTVVVGIDHENVKKSEKYVLEVLTIASKIDGSRPQKSNNLFQIGKSKGTIGHAVLRYKEGGELIVSAGHWIELSKLDTSVERVEQWAQQYGDEYQEDIQFLKSSSVSSEMKQRKMKEMTSMFVQQMPSCKQKKGGY